MSGHTPQNGEQVAEAIAPTLALFVQKAEPSIRRVSEEIYEQLLYSVQDYLRQNAEWNLGAEIDRCRAIERDNTQLRLRNEDLERALLGLENIMYLAESNASGTPDFDVVSDRVKFARHVLKAKGGEA